MAYTGQILDGYKEGAIVDSSDYNTANVFHFGTAVVWDTANRQWDLADSVAIEEIGFCIDDTNVSGADTVASAKLPVIVKNAWVATSEFATNATGADYVPLVADVGDAVQCSTHALSHGKWQLVAAPGAGEIYAGTLRDVITVNGVVMGVFDFEPRIWV